MRPINTSPMCMVRPDVLDVRECEEVVAAATRRGFESMGVDYPPRYRDNDRMVLPSPELAAALFERLRGALPEELVDDSGATHRLVGLNEQFRLCRYRGGQSFRIHQDGAHSPSDGVRSRLTVQIYLDERFRGGRTRFYRGRRGDEIGAIAPRTGAAVVFDHELWHDGEAVTEGTKHVMRTDVIYRRVGEPKRPAGWTARGGEEDVLRGHDGYVFVVRPLADGSLASGSRDRTIRTWRRDARGDWSSTRTLRGHQASVIALAELGGGTLVSGSRDRTVRAWTDDGAGRVLETLGGAVLSIAALDDRTIACGSADGMISVIDVEAGRVGVLSGHAGWVWSIAPFAGGRLASAADDGTVRVWDVARRTCVAAATPGRGPAHALAVLSNGDIAAAFADGHVVVYEVGDELAPVAVHRACDGEIYALHPLPGGGFASGGEDAIAQVRSSASSSRDAVVVARTGGFVRSICEVPGSNRLAVASYDGTIRIAGLGAASRA